MGIRFQEFEEVFSTFASQCELKFLDVNVYG